MLLVPSNTNDYIDKEEIPLDERGFFRRVYGVNRIYYCSCNMKVPYKLSKDNRFYPCKQGIKHEPNCSESLEYKKSQGRLLAYNENADENKISVNLTNDKEEYLLDERRCQKEVKVLNLRNYLEILFLSAYATMKRSTKPNKKNVYKVAYAKMCSTEVNYQGKKFILKSDEAPFKFFYGRLVESPQLDKKITNNGDEKVCYVLNLNGRLITVAQSDLKKACDDFKKRYRCSKIPNSVLCVVQRFKSKYKIESSWFDKTEIFLFPFSNKGCICSSLYECDLINHIEKMEEDQIQWYFYRPYAYGFGAYGDNYLEDGLIVSRGKKQKICLDIKAFNDEKYLKLKELKKSFFLKNDEYILKEYYNEPFSPKELMTLINDLK